VKCGRDLPVGNEADGTGKWVARKAGAEMAGWHMSQLLSGYVDPMDIVKEYADPPGGNLGDVMRLRLGLPYTAKEEQLRAGMVEECCGVEPMWERSSDSCAMGVDVGKTFHVVVGRRTGRERFEVVKLVRLGLDTGWNDLHDLARRFNVVSAVVDIRPYEDAARKWVHAHGFAWMCEYSENALTGGMNGYVGDDRTRVVKAYRTGMCDRTHRAVGERRLVLPRMCDEVKLYAKHLCAIAKVATKDARSGVLTYRYVGGNDDHYYHATNYFMIAASRIAEAAGSRRVGPMTAIHEYDLMEV